MNGKKSRARDGAARERFARAIARAEFGRFYASERDVAEWREAARKKRSKKPGH